MVRSLAPAFPCGHDMSEHTERGCLVDGCPRRHLARGLCGTHYARWWNHGHTGLLIGQEPDSEPACLDCGGPVPIKTNRASMFCTGYHRNRYKRRRRREANPST
jgi:hypothetical protein